MTHHTPSTPATNRQPITDERLEITPERLTLADLARLLAPSPSRDEAHSMNRSLLQRYDANKDLQALMGKQGATYPADSLPIWEAIALARAQEPPLVRPETAAVFAAGLLDRQPFTDGRLPITMPATAPEPAALVVAREIGGDVADSLRRLVAMGENMAFTDGRLAMIERLADALDRHREALERLPAAERNRSGLPTAPEDALLTLAEAHARYGLSLPTLRALRVKDGHRWKVRRSDVLRAIQSLQTT